MPTPTQIQPGLFLTALQQKISFFKVIVEEKNDTIEPLVFWLLTQNGKGHRFYIDAWTLHWYTYTEAEYKNLLEEDLKEYENYKVLDVMKQYHLEEQSLKSIGFTYTQEEVELCASLQLEFSSLLKIILKDYDTSYKSELIITTH